ncbi:MAG: TolC family protein [Bacteroidaceae bacterium]|nr:TolC family protein [Bacteroidaceae bacterium]
MRKTFCLLFIWLGLAFHAAAQEMLLSLDSCISMALRENKQLQIAKLQADIATNTRKAARTKYYPRVSAVGGYMRTGDEISLLSADQKTSLSTLGTSAMGAVQGAMAQELPKVLGTMAQMFPELAGQISQMAPAIMGKLSALTGGAGQALNGVGQGIVDAFRTDTRNMYGGAVMVNQPLYMGGAIIAGNKMADLAEEIAQIKIRKSEEDIVYDVQKAYYLVVEVEHKKQLADEYAALIGRLNADVTKMIEEGVATRADGLKVSVKLNEAEMQQLQAQDGLTLAKMLLCKYCGLPLHTAVAVDTEVGNPNLATTSNNNRAELQMLGKAVDLYDQKIKSTRAARLPQLLLTGGYLATNPNLFNGFQNKFRGTWNVGVLLKVPIWEWNENTYKVRSAKAQSNIARMELSDAQEMIDLQIQQTQFKLDEANRKYAVTVKNFETAEENLRCATAGFSEGVMTTTDVMMAQTAWLQAKTQKVEAEIGILTATLALNHAYGN